MAWAHVQSTGSTTGLTTTIAATFGSNNTAGNFILVAVRWNSVVFTASIADTIGNTYTAFTSHPVVASVNGSIECWYAKNIGAGANTITVTFTSACDGGLNIHEYSGLNTTAPADVFASATGTNASPDSGSNTTTAGEDLIFGAFCVPNDSGNARTPDSTFTSRADNRINSFDRNPANPIGSYHAFGTLGNSDAGGWCCAMGTFKIVGGPVTTYVDTGEIGQMAMSRTTRIPY